MECTILTRKQYEVLNKIKDSWNKYDQQVAKCQLEDYELIFIDEYGCPIDDFEICEQLYSDYKSKAILKGGIQ